jgi:Mrp family chromosome partitioning ATPase
MEMPGNSSPKTIATINFKGGVGKTTVTWCLADTLAGAPLVGTARLFEICQALKVSLSSMFERDPKTDARDLGL